MLGEQLLMSLKVMILGIGTVLTALVALIYVIEIINWAINPKHKTDEAEKLFSNKDIDIKEIQENNNLSEVHAKQHDHEEEIVAIIVAAIAASLNRSTHDIVVRNIKRIPYKSPAWNRAGRNQQISGRL